MKKIIMAETISIALSIIFVVIFRFLFSGEFLLSTTFFTLVAVTLIVVFAARAASVNSTDLSISSFIFAGSILFAAVIVLNVLTAVVIQIFPVLLPFIAFNIPITIIAFASTVFVLADAATIAKSMVAISLLVEAGLIVVGLTFVI